MNKHINPKLTVPLLAGLLAIALFLIYQKQAEPDKVSAFGQYQGYSEARYDGNQRISAYLTLSNGTRLAYDLILPTKNGIPADEPLPVLFKYTPYLRTITIFDENGKNLIADLFDLKWQERAYLQVRYWMDKERGRLMDPLFRTPWLEKMVKHGYAVIVVERPGTGASFGAFDAAHETGAQEADEILDWIAAQSWCDGKIGMYGDSFQAMIQLATAAMDNPHLKAIFPASAPVEMYNSIEYPGGIYNKAFDAFFTWATTFLAADTITPVDDDPEGVLLDQARAEPSRALTGLSTSMKEYPFRDSVTPSGTNIWEDRSALYPFITRINKAGTPVYLTNGWYDIFSDMFIWYNSLTVPKRLTVRPLDHSGVEGNGFDLDYGAEAHRWFDYWLKGIDNGIMDEPPLHYYVMGAPPKAAWQSAVHWPPANQQLIRFYFDQGKSGSIGSVNDGFLRTTAPTVSTAADTYTVDYTTTTGKHARWSAVNWPRAYPDLRTNDVKSLTYTTPPLAKELELIGHPIVQLWLTTTAPDLDLFVYLEEVKQNGESSYITEGSLRASHRNVSDAPFDNLGLPFHSHYQRNLAPIPAGEPVALVFNLLPTAYRFGQGNRVRVTVAFADADNFDTPIIDPAPTLQILRDGAHPSAIELPVVPAR